MVGTSLNIQTEPVYRHRAPGIEERMGSTEETLQNCTKSIPESIPEVFFPALSNRVRSYLSREQYIWEADSLRLFSSYTTLALS